MIRSSLAPADRDLFIADFNSRKAGLAVKASKDQFGDVSIGP